MFDITPPKYVRNVLKILSSHGYPACIVGGCVRDMILRVPPNDWDIATAAIPDQMLELFPDAIPTGIKHGTVTVRSGGQFVEVTTFRDDGEYQDHRHPDHVSFVGDLNTDLGRRDFTINAIALTSNGVLVDPYHGVDDIRARIIRAVGNPKQRFEEDALRMLRAFRFSSRLGFEIEEDTFFAILANAPLAAGLSAERVRDEIEKILLTANPESLYTVIECGLLDAYLLKHLSRDDGLIRIASIRKKALPRWALFCAILLADDCIESPEEFLRHLRLDNRTIRCCRDACALLMKTPPETSVDWKRLLRKTGVDSVECAAICWDAIYGGQFEDQLTKVLKSGECFSLNYLAVNGHDLAELGLKGKQLGKMLDFLLGYVIEYPENNRRELLLALASSGEE